MAYLGHNNDSEAQKEEFRHQAVSQHLSAQLSGAGGRPPVSYAQDTYSYGAPGGYVTAGLNEGYGGYGGPRVASTSYNPGGASAYGAGGEMPLYPYGQHAPEAQREDYRHAAVSQHLHDQLAGGGASLLGTQAYGGALSYAPTYETKVSYSPPQPSYNHTYTTTTHTNAAGPAALSRVDSPLYVYPRSVVADVDIPMRVVGTLVASQLLLQRDLRRERHTKRTARRGKMRRYKEMENPLRPSIEASETRGCVAFCGGWRELSVVSCFEGLKGGEVGGEGTLRDPMSQGTNNRLFNAIERAKQEVLQMHLSVSPNKDGRGLGFGMGQPITPPIHGAGDAGSTTGCLPPKAGEDRSASLRAPGNADGMSTSAAAAELLERFAAANAARAELNSQRSTALVSRGGGHVGSPQRGASTFPALKPASTVDPARDLFGHLGGGSPSRQLPTKPADHTPQHNQHNQHRHAVSHAPPSPNPYLREVSSAHATPLAHGDSHQQPHHPSSPPRSPAAYHASPPPPGGSNPSGVSEHGLAYLKALDATGLLLHGGKPSPPRSPPATGSSIVVRSIAASPAADLFRSYSAAGLPEAPGWRPGEAEPSRFPAGYGDAREIRKQADRIVEQARQDQIRAYSVRTESVDEQARHLAAGEDRRAQEQQALQHKQHQADQIRAYNAHTESIDEKNKCPASGEEWRALEQQVPHKQHQDQIRAYGAHTESIDEQKKYPASGEDLEQQRQGQMRAYSTHADSVAEQKRNLAAGDERAAREQQVLLQQQQALATQQADLREQQARWHATVGGEVERIRVEERQKALQHLRDHPPPPHLRPAGAPARDAPTPAVLALYLPPTHDEPAAFPADGPQFEETWRVVRDAWAAELAVWKELCVQKDNSSAQRDSDVATLKLRVRALESELSEAQAQLAQKCQAFAQQKAALLLRYGVAGDAAAEPGTSAAPQPTHQPAAGLSAAPAQ
eukprot:gene4350-6738_t